MKPLRERLTEAEDYVFLRKIDHEIINAHRQKMQFVGIRRIEMPLYRCYFFENQVEICNLSHLSPREYEMLKKILREPGFNPYIEYYILFENRVVGEGSVNAGVLVHTLFHLHHRIGSKFVLKDYVRGLYE